MSKFIAEAKPTAGNTGSKANGYKGQQINDHGEDAARE